MLGVGDKAPDFSLIATNGERYSLDDKLTLVIFFKTSCPTCQYAWPFYERVHKAYEWAGLEVLGISQHDEKKTREYAAHYGASFPHLIDEAWHVSRKYDPQFVPTGFLIGRDKEILEILISWNRTEMDRLSQIIASRLQVTAREIIRREEDVVVFKPG
jgi:peroxiredoxin